jgi:hypothetical protein
VDTGVRGLWYIDPCDQMVRRHVLALFPGEEHGDRLWTWSRIVG